MVDSDNTHDERYARRLKRRNMVVSHQFQRNSCRKNANKKNAEVEVSDVDDEYLNYVNTLSTFMDDNNGDEDAQFVDTDGHGHLNKNNGVSPCNSLNEVEDPDYKKFLQHLKKDGESYVLVIKEKNVFFKYEEKDQPSDSPQSRLKFGQKTRNNGANRSLRSSSRNKKVESPEKLGKVFDNKKNLLRQLNATSRKIEEKPLSWNQAKESQVPVVEKGCNVDCVEPIMNKLNRKSNKITGIGSLHSIEHPCKSDLDLDLDLDLESDMIDEDYTTFLANFLYKDDQRYPFMTVDGSSTVFEEDDESMSDVEVITIDIDPCKPNCTPFARKPFHTMDVDSGKILQSPGMHSRSSFRDRLMQALKRPYDSNEYRRLLQEANCHKAHHGSRNLRNGVKVFELDSFAESYLEQYNEVAMKIQLVEYDLPRVLNLLRGFFYWLQNLSHEGSFQPWMDPACLNVLPQPKLGK